MASIPIWSITIFTVKGQIAVYLFLVNLKTFCQNLNTTYFTLAVTSFLSSMLSIEFETCRPEIAAPLFT